ncbi:gamma-glutamylcyclotransferase family protein [Carboxydocella sp. ULO1]|uniref:gamma-glutamylcyclotransferase family protein n=1 Tax=Carboxydocella sp. ULO1 TaxID=1926599 RepID=UPI0009AD8CF1|nr:gamma-glutamylcyclotransferase family protein [Carboxydocella sp. ULO1]GAW28572.1 gamma-glutamylcyclotransferase [Carboxydocella sp. ULO1]
MLVEELKKLAEKIQQGQWPKLARGEHLWQGADVIIAPKLTESLKEWAGDDCLVLDWSGLHRKNRVLIISEHARELSALFYTLRDLCNDFIDFSNKYYFYGQLTLQARAAITAGADLQTILLAVVAEAQKLAILMAGRLYFAYGSNMDEMQMAERCKSAILLGKARLEKYKFLINSRGVASIIPDENSFVEGVVWSLAEQDEKELDRFEGVAKNYYYKQEIPVRIEEIEAHALVYIAVDQTPGQPRPGYLEKILTAAEKFQFCPEYSKELAGWYSA